MPAATAMKAMKAKKAMRAMAPMKVKKPKNLVGETEKKKKKKTGAKKSEIYRYKEKRSGKAQCLARNERKRQAQEEEEKSSEKAEREMMLIKSTLKTAVEKAGRLEEKNAERTELEKKEDERQTNWWGWRFDAVSENEEDEKKYWRGLGRKNSPVEKMEEMRVKRLMWFLEGVEAKRKHRIPAFFRGEDGDWAPGMRKVLGR